MIIDERDMKLLKKISDITNIGYGIIEVPTVGSYIENDSLIVMLEDLLTEYNKLEEDFEDYKNQEEIKDEYDFYGVSRNDF